VKERLTPLTSELAAQWSTTAQVRFLDALMSDPKLETRRIAFHGGTSLHLSWRSPRSSEDLDFLMAKNTAGIHAIIEGARKKTEEAFRADDPRFIVEIKDKTRDQARMISYHLQISHPGYLGKTLVKVEFWKVDARYLAKYPVELRAPMQPGQMVSRISNPVPAATLQTAYCDKLTAFATRPFLKWRDIYDLWWIGTQTDAKLELAAVVRQFLHNVSAYETIDGLPPARALRKFLELEPADVLKKADPDLRRWVPKALWAKLHPDVTRQMVTYARYALKSVADAIEHGRVNVSLKQRKG
jgi:hypothetical protein